MGILNDLGINEGMDKEQIESQLFSMRKKLVSRQNSADAQKRATAEKQLDALSSLQNAIDKAADDFPNVQLLVRTYGYSVDNGKLNNDLKSALENAAGGNGRAAVDIADFLGNNGQDDLRNQWMFWAAERGAAEAYQICGYLLTDSDPDNAVKWFEKAERANLIGVSNIYNWGLIYYRKKMYAQAKPKFESASAQGHAMASYLLAGMYENGYGVPKNLEAALQQYQLAKQRGLQDAQQGVARVAELLDQQNTQRKNENTAQNNAGNGAARPQQRTAQPNGQPTLVYKSDRKPVIPNLDDINIDSLKEKVNVGNVKGKVEKFAGKVDTDKIKKLPWKKIGIGILVFMIIISLFKSCAGNHEFSKNEGFNTVNTIAVV